VARPGGGCAGSAQLSGSDPAPGKQTRKGCAETRRHLFAYVLVLFEPRSRDRREDRNAYGRSKQSNCEMALGQIASRIWVPATGLTLGWSGVYSWFIAEYARCKKSEIATVVNIPAKSGDRLRHVAATRASEIRRRVD